MASEFKEQIAHDIGNAFLNLDEFGEIHNIDGQQINCVFDDETNRQKTRDGVYGSIAMLFVSTSDLLDRPVPGQHMRIDGDFRLVQKCIENMGMFEITLEANES